MGKRDHFVTPGKVAIFLLLFLFSSPQTAALMQVQGLPQPCVCVIRLEERDWTSRFRRHPFSLSPSSVYTFNVLHLQRASSSSPHHSVSLPVSHCHISPSCFLFVPLRLSPLMSSPFPGLMLACEKQVCGDAFQSCPFLAPMSTYTSRVG